jgi:hemoglobin
MLADIATHEDVERLVHAFYTAALADPVIGFLFADVAKLDLEQHLPRIARFWETVLLGAQTYSGGAFRPHLELHVQFPLKRGHFERWLWLWQETVDAMFAGPVADEAKRHAERVAGAFSMRLAGISAQREAGAGELRGGEPQPAGAFRVTRWSGSSD